MKIPVLSFFTGAGLLDIGMHNAGFDVIWRNEYYKPFVDGYQYGFSKLMDASPKEFPVCSKSISEITPYSIRNEAFSGKKWPESFGVVGGPPCPDFSVAGKHKGENGDNGKLTGVFFDQILGLLPTFFVFENVKGIISNHKNKKYLLNQLSKITPHYLFDIKVMNALEVGVPQDRERVIVVGFHRDYLSDLLDTHELNNLIDKNKRALTENLIVENFGFYNWFKWPSSDKFKSAKTNYVWPTTSPFGESLDSPLNLPLELCVGSYLQGLAELENQSDFFNPKSEKFNLVAEGDVSRKSFKRLHRWRYSPTAAYGNNEVHLHPYLPRRLSVREAMKIQTVPDGFALPNLMTLSNKYKTIGNGVPVLLAQHIATSINQVFKHERI